MKKTYMHPTTQIVKIETIQMIASSPLGIGDEYGTNGNNTVLGRGDSDWEYDD